MLPHYPVDVELPIKLPFRSNAFNSAQPDATVVAQFNPMFLRLTEDKPVPLPPKKKDELTSLLPEKKDKSTFLCLT
jgi:hypothetical protein